MKRSRADRWYVAACWLVCLGSVIMAIPSMIFGQWLNVGTLACVAVSVLLSYDGFRRSERNRLESRKILAEAGTELDANRSLLDRLKRWN